MDDVTDIVAADTPVTGPSNVAYARRRLRNWPSLCTSHEADSMAITSKMGSVPNRNSCGTHVTAEQEQKHTTRWRRSSER
jgi:hypothetical protein